MPFYSSPAPKRSFRLSAPAGSGWLSGSNPYALLLGLFFFGFLPLSLFPQSHLFEARALTTEDGLANLMATAIYKDKQGFIWVATAYGLNRYDGYNFKLFLPQENARPDDVKIARIGEDDRGRLWLFYINGLYMRPMPKTARAIDVFDPETGRAVPFETFFAGNAPFKAGEIYLPRVLDPQNRLWIHTDKGELYLHSRGRFKKIFQRKGAFFRYITVDGEENIWLGRQDSLLAIDTLGRVLQKLRLPGPVFGIWAGPDGAIGVATQEPEGQRISLWRKPKNGSLSPFQLLRNGQPAYVQNGYPFFHCTREGYWFANMDDQLHLFGPQGEWLCNYSSLLEKEPNTAFFSSVEDGGKLWMASSSGALRVSVRDNPFQLIHKKEKILSDCRGITEDENGNIYFLNTHVFQWDVSAQKCRQLPDPWGAGHALLYTDSTLWVGTYGVDPAGFQLNLRTLKTKDYPPFDSTKFLVLSLSPTSSPQRFMAGLNRGVAYLDLLQQKLLPFDGYHSFSAKDSLLEQSEVNYIHKNPSGFWLATSRGVFLLNEKKGVLRHYGQASGSLPFDHIRHIYEDKEGVFWLASRGGGLIRWQPTLPEGEKQGGYRQFTVEDGLADNFTYAVYEDEYGKLWIPSDKGLMQMDKASFRIRTFTTEDGLPHNEFNHSAHYQAKDGTLYFGGLGGLIAFHPRVFAAKGADLTSLALTGCYVLEEGTERMTDKTSLLRGSGAITIHPGDKFLELHFTLLDFEDAEQHRYAYQIEGYSNTWNYINENFLRITHLPYGKYTLRIRGQNRSRGWSGRELSLVIRVLRPFYLRWWFLAALVGLAAGATAGAVRWRIRSLEKGKERLEAEVQKRTLTIQRQAEELKALDKAKSRFFANITHEFRTPLTLIIGPMEQLASTPGLPSAFRKRIVGVLKNARHLLTLINQLLDLSRIESGRMRTEVIRGDIIAYTKSLAGRFQPLAREKGLRLYFDAPADSWETCFDKDKWDKICFNLLSNAIKFTPAGQEVRASVMEARKNGKAFIRLEVKDSGIGIEEEHLSHIFNRFYQAPSRLSGGGAGAGIGLSLVKELVELQGGEVRVSSQIGKGASFEVYLPVPEVAQAPLLAKEPLPEPVLVPSDEETTAPPVSGTGREAKLELLLIEDNAEMREYIRYCIDATRYNITEAADGEEGIQKALALIPDLIISDVMMPKKDGFEVVKAIRGHIGASHIPLILLTARASLESRLEGLGRGADAYLTKPFSPQELALRIDKLIEIRRLLQRRYRNGLPADGGEGAYRQEDEFIANLRSYILEHLGDPGLDVGRLCKHTGMSRVHLYRKMKALTGKSVGQFVREARMEAALALIREGRLNLSEIAHQTGFSSLSHFSRTFKSTFGQSPSEMKQAD